MEVEDNEASQSNQKMAFMRGFKLGRLQLDRQELGPLDQLSYDSLNTDGGEVRFGSYPYFQNM